MRGTVDIVRLGNTELFAPKELSEKSFRRTEWKLKIAQASASGSTMREVLGLFASLADGAVFLLDKDLKISYFSGSSHTSGKLASALLKHGGADGTRPAKLPDGAELTELLDETSEDKLIYQNLEDGELCWVSTVKLEKTEDFFIVLITAASAELSEIPVLFGMLQECFEEINLRRLHGDVPPGDTKAFITALTGGTLSEWDDIDAYAKRLPSPPRKYMTIAVAQASPMGRNSVESLSSQLKAFFPDCSCAVIGDQIVMIISNSTRAFQPKPIFSEKDMHSLLTRYDGSIAFSNVTQRLDMLRTNYLLAESTLRLGKAIQERGGSRIFYYEDYAEYIAIELSLERYREIMRHDDLLFLTCPDAVTLYRYDYHNGTDLQTVLYYFCKNNGNISSAAKEAFMHRNTFSARMAQIREILSGVDLSDGRVQHRMLFSCRVFRYYNLYYDKNAPKSLSERLSFTEGA